MLFTLSLSVVKLWLILYRYYSAIDELKYKIITKLLTFYFKPCLKSTKLILFVDNIEYLYNLSQWYYNRFINISKKFIE